MIAIVGLGPGDPQLITRSAWDRLTAAAEVWVRTRRHPAVPALTAHTRVHSYDHLHEAHDDFTSVYAAIASDVVARAEAGEDVVYAVPGDPGIAEASTQMIRSLAAARNLRVEIYPGISFLEPTFATLESDPIHGVQIVDALTLASAHHPPGSPQMGMLVPQLYSRFQASDVKLTLMNAYPDDHRVTLISGAGTAAVRVRSLPLYEMDRSDDFDDLTTLWVPAQPHAAGYDALQEVIAHLRAPEGCPWDREQTHESLRPYLLEESYEVLEAIDAGDLEALCEELGDLLIQAALHIQIATEESEFKLADVIEHVVGKLIRRHPHVFADVEVRDAEEVTRNWEAIKRTERQTTAKKTLLDGVPKTMPALALAQSYVERLVRVGYPLPAITIAGETALGRNLLQAVEQAQAAGLDAESALRQAAAGLSRRLETIEGRLEKQGKALTDLSPAEQRPLWANG